MQFTDLFYGFVIDWSFYPLTVVGEPERVMVGTWRVKVYNNVTGTRWFEGYANDIMKASARPADFGPHPTADEYYAEKARLADIERAKKQREHEAYMAKLFKDIERAESFRNELRAAREARELEALMSEDAF